LIPSQIGGKKKQTKIIGRFEREKRQPERGKGKLTATTPSDEKNLLKKTQRMRGNNRGDRKTQGKKKVMTKISYRKKKRRGWEGGKGRIITGFG